MGVRVCVCVCVLWGMSKHLTIRILFWDKRPQKGGQVNLTKRKAKNEERSVEKESADKAEREKSLTDLRKNFN